MCGITQGHDFIQAWFVCSITSILSYFCSRLRYCQQVLNETVRTAKLTPVAARLQEVEGKVDQHVIPKEVSGFLLSVASCA